MTSGSASSPSRSNDVVNREEHLLAVDPFVLLLLMVIETLSLERPSLPLKARHKVKCHRRHRTKVHLLLREGQSGNFQLLEFHPKI
jgi:hypothetical protein